MSIRVGICDDQALVRDGLGVQLGYPEDIEVVGEAPTGSRPPRSPGAPRRALDDIRIPRMDGIEATREIVADPAASGVRVLILTTFVLDEHVYAALAAAASGFILKDAMPEEIVQAVRVVAAGESLLAPRVTSRLIREFASRPRPGHTRGEALKSLTDREVEVLQLIAQGLSNTEVADQLVISHATGLSISPGSQSASPSLA